MNSLRNGAARRKRMKSSNPLAALCAALVIIGVAAGCGSDGGSAGVPAIGDAEGTYDATVEEPSTSSRLTVGTVDDSGLAVGIRFPALDDGMAGALQADGTIVGQDGAIARIEERSRTVRVTGMLASGATFQMERPLGADARRFSDLYRFSFARSVSGCECPTTEHVSFRFPKSGDGGLGSIDADFEVGAAGEIVGDIARPTFSSVSVSPRGRLVIVARYESHVRDASRCAFNVLGEACDITIEATLPAAGKRTTTGKFALNAPDSVTLGTIDVLRGPPPRPEPTGVP